MHYFDDFFCKISTLCTAWPPHVVSMNSTLAQAKPGLSKLRLPCTMKICLMMSSTTMNIAGSVFGFKLQVVFYRMPCFDDFFHRLFFSSLNTNIFHQKNHAAEYMMYQNMKLFQWRPPCMICNSRSVFKFNFATIELFHISLFCFLLSLV